MIMDECADTVYKIVMRRSLFMALILVSGLFYGTRRASAMDPAEGFQNPPNAARMWVWWFWMQNHVSQETISRDLEELKAKGIGGVTVYSIVGNPGPVPSGPDFMSPAWRDLFKHTVREADRLGLGVSLVMCSGWNAGGPWMPPADSCKSYVQSESTLKGPLKFSGKLPPPPGGLKSYWDLNVQAFRAPPRPGASSSDLPKEAAARDPRLLVIKSAKDMAGGTVRQINQAPLTELPLLPSDRPIPAAKVIDLTAKLAPDGTLTWDVPAGEWTILRTGCRLTGTVTQQTAPGGTGPEADPLDPAAMDCQFQHVAEVLLNDAGDLAGKTLRSFQIDSWEINLLNGTRNILGEFEKYRGYDPRPYLAALSGRLVENAEVTDRFLYDYRKTIADCVADHYYGRLTALADRRGCLNQSEAGGPCYPQWMCMEGLKNLGRCDVPMGECWQDGWTWLENGQDVTGKQTASAAHLYGKRLAAAEAFTGFAHWQESPATLKPTADRAFCEGFNWLFIFSTATQPEGGLPGVEMWAGTHFNRNLTWWNQARPFTDYLARCQFLLREGLFTGDVCYYQGDGAPMYVEPKHVDPSLGPGYDYDVCNTEILLTRMAVQNGRIVLPDGMSYRLLVLPERKDVPVEVLRKIKELAAAGATVAGPRPEKASGLKDYPRCDRAVRELAAEVWGDCDGKTVTEHPFGKGRVAWGKPLREILRADQIPPDFECQGKQPGTWLDFIHRRTEDAEIYFVANRNPREESATCTFRVEGKTPELWDPATGEMRGADAHTVAGGRTSVPLRFAPFGSIFVVFRKASLADKNFTPLPLGEGKGARANSPKRSPHPSPLPAEEVTLTIAGPWTVTFDPRRGGPESAQFERLVSWTQRPEEGIKFYSGTARYRKTFDLPESARTGSGHVYLDLGVVRDVAEIKLNGRDLGVLWTAPWRVEISGAVRPAGNVLEIAVTNLWPNRLIGDAALPVEKRITRTNIPIGKDQPLLESGLLGPVRLFIQEKGKE
jgi:hypothetical protein